MCIHRLFLLKKLQKELEALEISGGKAHDEVGDEIGNFENDGAQKVAKAMKKIERKPRAVKPKKDVKVTKSRTNKK